MARSHSGQRRMMRSDVVARGLLAFFLTLALVVTAIPPSAADDALDARQLVEKSQLTIESFMTDQEIEAIRDLITKARGVFIAPQVLKGAFIVGASGGSGCSWHVTIWGSRGADLRFIRLGVSASACKLVGKHPRSCCWP